MENLTTVTEAAKIIKLTTRQVQRLCKDGTLKGAKVFGKMWLIPKESIERYLKEKKEDSIIGR